MLIKDGHDVNIYDAEWNTNIEKEWINTRYPLYYTACNWYKYPLALQDPAHKAWKEAEKVIRERDPDIVGITARALDLASALVLARIIKSVSKDKVVVLGGPAATTCTDLVLEDRNVDFVIRGEAEVTMVDLLRAIQQPNPDYRLIDGLSFRDTDNIVHNRPRALIEDISSLPFPARDRLLYADRLPRNLYAAMMGDMVTSRGCSYNCAFCASYSIWGSRVPRTRTAENCVDEILHVRDTYGSRRFLFWDDLFTISRQRAIEICNLLLEKKANVSWLCLVRANTLDEGLLKIMKQAGCIEVQVGVESGSDRILKKVEKGVTLEQVRKAAYMIRKSQIPWRAFLIIGIPGETKEEMDATINLIPELHPNVVELGVFAPYPGSPLCKDLKEAGLLPENWMFSDFLNVEHCYTQTMSAEEFRGLALRYLKECDEYNYRMNKPRSRYAYYLRHPVLLTKKLVEKLVQ
jgi:radical SAM superfamily enzyme YgiQ (UPF0313 family)